MQEEFEILLIEFEDKNNVAIQSLENNFNKIQTGRANPNFLSSIKVLYYGENTFIHTISSITIPEGNQLLVKPFDKSITKDISIAIDKAQLGVSSNNEGDQIRIIFPILTTERRKELSKSTGKFNEQTKIFIRKNREHARKTVKDFKDIPEELEKNFHDQIQNLTDKYVSIVEKITKNKEKDLMSM
ncbi:MAG: ribosome recycling factor [Mollicutes bacterium PWAP]|nr:ribosome recycling factor [Mollicutes bacterium PWAP]